ncbi:hypothetical protein [Arthrobacter sp. PsM3]|uniref:hypothetical protein n=1 Tax=Arthrobacter sp. PsM3 TaxID=3030531 RepID=UPI00263B75E3|nr:hypothetical protein [Arthrobacter sp. PsM3]MDN4644926.1 hypothetical protein [Arthrobacter sp. PsM3]
MGVAYAFPGDYSMPRKSLVRKFPKSWLTSVTVLRGGGRDAKGNPLPTTEITVTGCLIAPRATAEPVYRADVVSSTAVLYRDPGFTFLPDDRIRVPAGARMAGTWSVDGRVGDWPHGVEVGLVLA